MQPQTSHVPCKPFDILVSRPYLRIWNIGSGISDRQDAAFFSCIAAGVEDYVEIAVHARPLLDPVHNVFLLIVRFVKDKAVGEDGLLVRLCEPWDNQSDLQQISIASSALSIPILGRCRLSKSQPLQSTVWSDSVTQDLGMADNQRAGLL